MPVDNDDLALSPERISSLGNALGRFLARGGPYSVYDRFRAVYHLDAKTMPSWPRSTIRKIREVMSDITMRPCASLGIPRRPFTNTSRHRVLEPVAIDAIEGLKREQGMAGGKAPSAEWRGREGRKEERRTASEGSSRSSP